MPIKRCNCVNKFQDREHGKGNRVHTPTKDGYRCTVCEQEKNDRANS